jgi:hypothetical protein
VTQEKKPRKIRKYQVLKMLLELDPSKLYRFKWIRSFLIEKGLTYFSAEDWVKVLAYEGFLKKVDQGLYMVDVEKIRRELEELEKELEEIENKLKEKILA